MCARKQDVQRPSLPAASRAGSPGGVLIRKLRLSRVPIIFAKVSSGMMARLSCSWPSTGCKQRGNENWLEGQESLRAINTNLVRFKEMR